VLAAALAIVLGRKGTHAVSLWALEPEVRDSIASRRVNDRFLPGISVPESVHATNNLEEALAAADLVISVVPSQHCRKLFAAMQSHLHAGTPIISATKGLEERSLVRMTEVIRQTLALGSRVAALSGPSFAVEVARGNPTAVTIASSDPATAELAQQVFSDAAFRVYTHDDVIGVELGGALKNVIAIAAGVCSGLGLGHNSIAALITRGLAEITRLAVACGGRSETLAGLSGLGDLVLTCTGDLSRNRSVGVELGRGRRLPEIIAGMHGMVAEGIFTTNAAIGLARRHQVEMPITEQMYAVLHDGKSPCQAIHDLMTRPTTSETRLHRD